jgi:hypothetical protein
MCHKPTGEEVEQSEARKALAEADRDERRQPWTYPEPRGNQDLDDRELERSTEKLVSVLGH